VVDATMALRLRTLGSFAIERDGAPAARTEALVARIGQI